MQVNGTCKYCGKIRMVDVRKECEADAVATLSCECREGQAARKTFEQKERAIGTIGTLAHETEPWVEKILVAGIDDMQSGFMKSMTVKTFEGITFTMKTNGNGVIVVERKENVIDHLEA